MGVEIERRFLVSDEAFKSLNLDTKTSKVINQCYISHGNGVVRVRSILNVGDDSRQGIVSFKKRVASCKCLEYEYEIPANEARQLMRNFKMEDTFEVSKCRFIKTGKDGLVWEIDLFIGDNLGLIVAEVELDSVDQEIDIPEWVGEEITDENKYANIYLSKKPFNQWDMPATIDELMECVRRDFPIE